MEEGLPIEGITNTIINNMVAGGVINYDVGLLMTPEVGRVIRAIAENAEIDYVYEIPRQINTEFVDAQIKKIEEGEKLEVKEEEEEETEKDEKPKRKGLMEA